MADAPEPIVKLEPGGKASVLGYNVPEPTTYPGNNLIEIDVLPDWFKDEPGIRKPLPQQQVSVDLGEARHIAREYFETGKLDDRLLRAVDIGTLSRRSSTVSAIAVRSAGTVTAAPTPRTLEIQPRSTEPVSLAISTKLEVNESTIELAAQAISQGSYISVFPTLWGKDKLMPMAKPPVVRPRLLLIEKYRLASFLGLYGAGRIVKTFTLLPGEKTKINVKTYMHTKEDAKSASSVLDSFSETSSDDFEKSVQSENSDKRNEEDKLAWHVEGEASASWGWGSAKISGGASGESNSSREQFSKNVSSATNKHAATASAKRDVQINTSYEVSTEQGEETSIERTIENINVSRTLNFIFRQMNQQFFSALHLIDLEIGFFNGQKGTKRVVPLSKLDGLLDEIIVPDPEKKKRVKEMILGELENIADYRGNTVSFVEQVHRGSVTYNRPRYDLLSTYKDELSGTSFTVKGIIVSVQEIVMRTDGVIVEALLGQASALDTYSEGLQNEAIETKRLDNALKNLEVKRAAEALKILQARDDAGAKVYAQLYPPPKSPPA